MDDWRTPPALFAALDAEFDFDLDAAATSVNALCRNFLHDALLPGAWPGHRVFVNPPYGRMLEPFARRCLIEAQGGKTVVGLFPMRTRAAWWHECVVGGAYEVRCVRKRPKFLRPDGSVPRFTMSVDSAVIVWCELGGGRPRLTSWEW